MKKLLTVLTVFAVIGGAPDAAAEALSYEGLSFEVPPGWAAEEDKDFGMLYVYPLNTPANSETIIKIFRMRHSATDVSRVWEEAKSDKKNLSITYTVLEESIGLLAGRPAQFVTFTQPFEGREEISKTYEVYVSTQDGAPLTIIKYVSEVGNYDRFLPEARALFESIKTVS
jgi:hypothetical protein